MRKWKLAVPEHDPDDETGEQIQEEAYVRLVPEEWSSGEPELVRLGVPKRDEIETKSCQPEIDDLIEDECLTLSSTEEQWGTATAERKPLPWGWFVLIGLILSGGALWSLVRVRSADHHLETIRLGTGTLIESEETANQKALNLLDRIEAVIEVYLSATDVESRLRVVRHPNRVRQLMEDHYSRHEFDTYGKPRIDSLRPLTLANYGDFWMAMLRFDDGTRTNLIIQADEESPARVDWETAVCYQPMDWDRYVQTRPEDIKMDFRVYLEPDLLFSHEFQDASAWGCYKLTALGREEVLFGYVRQNSPSGQLLREWFRRHPNSQDVSMILRLSIPQGMTSPRGVVIDEVLSVRWIYIESPTE